MYEFQGKRKVPGEAAAKQRTGKTEGCLERPKGIITARTTGSPAATGDETGKQRRPRETTSCSESRGGLAGVEAIGGEPHCRKNEEGTKEV